MMFFNQLFAILYTHVFSEQRNLNCLFLRKFENGINFVFRGFLVIKIY